MEKTSFLKNKLQEFISSSDSMNEEELRQVVVFMLEISNNHIDRLIKVSEENVAQNKEITRYKNELERIIIAFNSFIEAKSLNKEFEFYLRGFDAS